MKICIPQPHSTANNGASKGRWKAQSYSLTKRKSLQRGWNNSWIISFSRLEGNFLIVLHWCFLLKKAKWILPCFFLFCPRTKRINRWIRTGVRWTLCGWDLVCKLQLRRVCSQAVKEMLKWATRQCHHQSEWRACSELSVQKSGKRQICAGATLPFRRAPGNQDR